MDEANRKNPLETDGRNPLPEHLAARERALYEAAAELERLTDQLFGAEGAGRDCAIASEDPIDGLAPDVVPHEALSHKDAQVHHHHTHAPVSRHEHGHHLLQVEDLSVGFRMYDEDAPFFRAKQREVEVIHSLSISVHAGEIVAVVGASGSGKTLLADAVLGLFEPNATVRGRVWFDGAQQDAASLSALRGHGISLVPQSVNNLDPLIRWAARWRASRTRTSRAPSVVVGARNCSSATDCPRTRRGSIRTSCRAAWRAAFFCAARSWTTRASSWPTSPRPASTWIWPCARSTTSALSPTRAAA